MKKFFLVTVFATFAGGAIAADLRPAYKAGPVAVPRCASFGGWYVGANVGYGYYDHKFSDRDALGPSIDSGLSSTYNDTRSGANGGVQAGYNYQSGCTVFGVEADWSWTGLRASSFNQDGDQVAGGLPTDSVTLSSKLDWFGTARLRTGVVVDNLLLYVTGGLAYANFNRTATFFNDGPPAAAATLNWDRTRFGWTAGVGTEWSFAPNWSLKSEVLYMRFEKDDVTFTGTGPVGNLGVPYRLESQDQVFISRVGVNYRFGG
jgi:outer membrane immunogenic protein